MSIDPIITWTTSTTADELWTTLGPYWGSGVEHTVSPPQAAPTIFIGPIDLGIPEVAVEPIEAPKKEPGQEKPLRRRIAV